MTHNPVPTGRRTVDVLWDEFVDTCADNDEDPSIRNFAHWILQVWQINQVRL